jgi:hypothetical protein
MADGLGLFLIMLFSGICLVALFSGLRVIFPRVVEQTQTSADLLPGRSFVIGLVNVLFFGAIASGFGALSNGLNAGIFILPALVILAGLGIGLSLGLTGMTIVIGQRLFPEESQRRQTAWGSIVLILGSLTPVVGWFGFFPYLSVVGLGGFILGWFRRSQTKPPKEEDHEG